LKSGVTGEWRAQRPAEGDAAHVQRVGDVLAALAVVDQLPGGFDLRGGELRLAPEFDASALSGFTPARVRSVIRLCSDPASTAIVFHIARLVGVSVSMASGSD